MATLLHGQKENVNGAQPEAEPGWLRHKRLIQVSLVLADLMLLAVTVRWLLQSQPLGPGGIGLGLLALLLVAWLSCLAFWLEFKN